jgi:putative PEP-CTERM system TPR-repeat lipoprotein
MQFMNTIKIVVFVSLMQILASCNQEEDTGDVLVEVQSHLNLAQVYMDQGQFRASIIETQNAAQLIPDNLETLKFIGKLYIELGDTASAIEAMNNALTTFPDNAEIKLLLGEAYLEARQPELGIALIEPLQVSQDLEVQKKWLLGSLQAAAGNTQAATTTLLSALESNSTHIPTLITLSKLSYLTGDYDRTNQYVEQAVQASDGEDEDLWIWRGQLAMLQEDYPTAEQAYFEALDIMSLQDIMTAKRYTTLQSILVPLRMQQKNNEALRYSQIIANSPQGEFSANYKNAFTLLQQGSIADAEKQLTEILATAPNHPGSNILLGLAKYSDGDFTEAQRLLSQYVDADTATPQLVIALATTHMQLNQPEKALAVLQNALVTNPQDTSILTMVGIIERGQGKINESINTLTNVLSTAPQAELPHYEIAGSYLQLQDYDQAIAHLEEAIRLNPNFTQAKSALLNTYVARQDTSSANQLVQKWLDDDDTSAFNNSAAGALASASGDFTTARTYFNKVLQNDPENSSAMLYLAGTYAAEKNFTESVNTFASVLAKDPTNVNALGGLLAVGDLAGSSPDSVARVEQIINDNPTQYIPSLVLGQYYLNKADLDNAYSNAEKAVSIVQNDYTINLLSDITNTMVSADIQQKDYVAARALLDKILALRPEHVRTIGKYVEVEAAAGNYSNAQELVEKARQIQPEQAYSYELEGDLLRSQDKTDDALAAFRTGWSMQPTSSLGTKIYQILVSQNEAAAATFLDEWMTSNTNDIAPKVISAMSYQQANDNARAIPLYEEVIATAPTHLVALNNLAWLIQDSDPDRAIELAKRAADLYPNNAEVVDTYGWILFRQDRQDEAKVVLSKAMELAPDSAAIKEHWEAVQ